MNSDVYRAAGCSADRLCSYARDPVFADLFSGTGSMSKQAERMGFKTVVTLDWDERFEPEYCTDIMDIDEDHPFIIRLNEFIREGRMIVMHASPPCNSFSTMNTTGEKDIESAMRIVESATDIMKRYSVAYTLENPATGTLWDQPYAQQNFTHFHNVDYCAYGSILKKSTRFVFSNSELRDMVQPRRCPSKEECPACYMDPRSHRMRHTNFANMEYEERISIPPQLCLSLLASLRVVAEQTAYKFASEIVTSHKRPRPRYENDEEEEVEEEEQEEEQEEEEEEIDEWKDVECLIERRGISRGMEYLVRYKEHTGKQDTWVHTGKIPDAFKREYKALHTPQK